MMSMENLIKAVIKTMLVPTKSNSTQRVALNLMSIMKQVIPKPVCHGIENSAI